MVNANDSQHSKITLHEGQLTYKVQRDPETGFLSVELHYDDPLYSKFALLCSVIDEFIHVQESTSDLEKREFIQPALETLGGIAQSLETIICDVEDNDNRLKSDINQLLNPD